MRVATSILRDRVFDQVRLRRALSYAPNAFLNDQRANTGGIYVTAVDANAAVRVMLAEISRLQTEPVDPGEIESVAAQFLTNYYVDQQTNAAQTGTLARAEILGGGWQRSTSLIERINAVTPFDVRRAAARYMRHIQFIVLGPDDDIERPIFLQEPGPAGPTTLNLLLPAPRIAEAR
jgi:predicted Zn-dependent peptidase